MFVGADQTLPVFSCTTIAFILAGNLGFCSLFVIFGAALKLVGASEEAVSFLGLTLPQAQALASLLASAYSAVAILGLLLVSSVTKIKVARQKLDHKDSGKEQRDVRLVFVWNLGSNANFLSSFGSLLSPGARWFSSALLWLASHCYTSTGQAWLETADLSIRCALGLFGAAQSKTD